MWNIPKNKHPPKKTNNHTKSSNPNSLAIINQRRKYCWSFIKTFKGTQSEILSQNYFLKWMMITKKDLQVSYINAIPETKDGKYNIISSCWCKFSCPEAWNNYVNGISSTKLWKQILWDFEQLIKEIIFSELHEIQFII